LLRIGGNGKISPEEIKHALYKQDWRVKNNRTMDPLFFETLYIKVTNSQVQRIVKHFDLNRDGKINFGEFAVHFQRVPMLDIEKVSQSETIH
jgi:Ca2+-binding EF-hand superfamily protein